MIYPALVRLAASTAMTLAVSAIAAPASAAQETRVQVNIPAQELGRALRTFGRAADQQIIFSEAAVAGKRSPALNGRYTVEDGLRTLTNGSGLSVKRTASGIYYLRASATADASEAVGGQGGPIEREVAEEGDPGSPIVVTGSRIRRSDPETAAPVRVFDRQDLEERGYVQVGDLLNDATANTPSFPVAQASGFPGGPGKTYPNLFNLGAGRTLTLLNGRRMVSSSSGLGDRIVDTNVIPAGLIRRVDIVQAGGAAVYGSDAIAGVVNYVLRDDFDGLEIDLQNTISSRKDDFRPYARLTAGKNFGGGRGNIAVNLEYAKTDPLLENDRPFFSGAYRNVTNLANVSATDGRPPTIWVPNGRLWQQNRNGVLFASTAVLPSSLLRLGGQALQFAPDGNSVIPYDTGIIQGTTSTAIGGEGRDTRDLSTLATGVERYSGTAIAHFDVADGVRLVGEFVYGKQIGFDPLGYQGITRTLTGTQAAGTGIFTFNRTNPYLTPAAIATLSAANPAFAAGGNLFLARMFDILPTRNRAAETDTWRALVGVEGDFTLGARNFYYSVTGSRGETTGFSEFLSPIANRINNSLNAVRNGAGQIVCAVNADAITTNDDPACVTINPFGNTPASAAAIAYLTDYSGSSFKNVQDNVLATLGGDLIDLPGGTAKFSVAYEHRREFARLTPNIGDQLGIFQNTAPQLPIAAKYRTHEFSGELLVPLIGEDFTIPLVRLLEATGSYRHVDNSIAGKEQVWGAGLRWDTGYGLTFRGSRSRNFRAPSLEQLFAPVSFSGLPIGTDPCDADRITGGPSPAVRLRNCQALFAANPSYGPLATFQDISENTGFAQIASGGNPGLRNEISNTLTYGLAFQPDYIPGLTLTIDRIEVDLRDGLTTFSPATFLQNCYDSTDYPNEACGTFTRNAQGYITTARSTTFNAAIIKYRGEVYNLNYRMPLENLFGPGAGTVEFGVEATHTSLALTNATQFAPVYSQGTTANPDWRGRFDLRYSTGPFRLFYQVFYLPEVKSGFTDTIETVPFPRIGKNYRHTISVQYELENITFRAGVNNLTDSNPSFPVRSYGDIFGRQFFVGAKIRLR